MFKNVTGQRWIVYAYEDGGGTTPGAPKTGDAAQITAKIAKDGAAAAATNDVNPTELEDGYYEFDLTQAETNADELWLTPESSTANIQVIACPPVVYTRPQYFGDLNIASDGDFAGNVDGTVATVTTLTGHTAQTGDSYARLGSPAGADMSTDIAAVKTDTGNLVSRITSTLFSGITSLAEWLGLLAGKQAGDATALTEIAATGAGSGTFDEATDSLEAIRDRGDAAWITGGGGGLTQALNVQAVLPTSIDLANTATVRVGLILLNSLDDLPSTAEITPGTISIERKAIGGTSWSSVVSDAAMSEQAGMVYYDEVFDTGTGYAEGDSIRVTFKSVSITADTNTYEVCDANGLLFQSEIRQTMRGTDSAATAAALSTTDGKVDTVDTVVDGIQTDLSNGTDGLGALKTLIDAIQTDLSNGTDGLGALKALIDALNDLSAADVNAQVVDVLKTDTVTLPGQEAPSATPTMEDILAYLYKAWRNKSDQDSTTYQLYADDGSTVDHKATVSESGGTVTKGEVGTGP